MLNAPKKIIHVDMDAFFASIEQRDRPELRGKPVVVGGSPESRSVVATASYEARKFGIRSAMPCAQARRLCPQAVFLPPSFEKYQRESDRIFAILKQHTGLVESVSLDEAYLDVTQNRFAIKDAAVLARLIQQNIFAATGLTASAGVAPFLYLAKIASDLKKPNGLTVVLPSEVSSFLENLPVRKIPGVGPVTEKTLAEMGVSVCGDLLKKSETFWARALGKWGLELYRKAQGREDREVVPYSEPKQCGAEETFDTDTKDRRFLERKLTELSEIVHTGLSESGRMGRTIVLKVKYHDFETITRSRTLPRNPGRAEEVAAVVKDLLAERTEAGRRAIRLLGVSISGLERTSRQKKIERDLFLS